MAIVKRAQPEGAQDGVISTMRLRLILDGKDAKFFPLLPGSNLIGRWDQKTGSFPEVDLEEFDSEAKVSRKHAIILLSESGATVEDAGSKNGTFLNRKKKLEPGVPYELKVGDEILVGKILLRYEAGA
jgi:pSer/pThr/pTyr-binding forkhead associated (FHA) protein